MGEQAPLLAMRGVEKSFGPTRALRGVSLEVRAGEVVALLGENGAGKSTLIKVLSGAHGSDAGAMELSGASYAPAGPQAARRAGVATIYQELTIAPELSIEDNVWLGRERSRRGLLARGEQRAAVRAALERLGHAELDPRRLAGELSVGLQQVVEIARALVHEARVVVFDEPTSSLAQADVEALFALVRRLRDEGLGVLYISHFLEEVRQVADRYCVLRDGESVDSGELTDVSDARLVASMVGREVDELFPSVPRELGEELLVATELAGVTTPRRVDLRVRRGEIFGLAGLVGAGRSESLRVCMALDPERAGEVRVAGVRSAANPRARLRAGLGMLSEDRKGEGLAQELSIAENLTLSALAPYTRRGLLDPSACEVASVEWMQRLQIKAHGPRQRVAELSGGNQQKVALARLLHQDADVLLLDEPTRGIDVGTKAEIYRLMGESAARGKALVFVSSYVPELLAVCDTIGVMHRGELLATRAASAWDEESLLAIAIGGEHAA